MEVPSSFRRIDDECGLIERIKQLGYRREARYVAFWWEQDDNQMAWIDSDLRIAIGMGDNVGWLFVMRDYLECYSLGADGESGESVLVWDRRNEFLWIAPRRDGLKFVCRNRVIGVAGDGAATRPAN